MKPLRFLLLFQEEPFTRSANTCKWYILVVTIVLLTSYHVSSNPLSSVKDRLALAIIEDAEASGELKPGQTVVEASESYMTISCWVTS